MTPITFGDTVTIGHVSPAAMRVECCAAVDLLFVILETVIS